MAESNSSKVETKTFETEIQQLLDLITHSLYSHKEIFIRELVSNASDAIDKVRFLSLTRPEVLGSDSHLEMKISLDSKAGTFSISDNGIGMSRQELIDNIGTIARSGSKAFLSHLSEDKKKDVSLIGQFGVGFYSVFMVSDKVTILTKKAEESEAWKWESDGKGRYTLEPFTKDKRGTEIILHLNEEGKEYLEDWKVRSIIRKFSDFVSHDILMPKIDTRSEEEKQKDAKEGKIFKSEYEIINSGKALWTRPKNEITDAMYEDFYKHISHDFEEPMSKVHFTQEGLTNFTSVLFIPKKAPFDLFTNPEPKGIQLYVKRVFIMDTCKTLLPQYLRFVKGIVDTEDLPLNVSREILQENKIVDKIRKALVKKVLDLLKEMSVKEPDKYKVFWKEMGIVLKEGVHFDFENKDKIAELLRFHSSFESGDEQWVSLKEYVSRMKSSQKEIYYIASENLVTAAASPHLEIFRKKNIEVLYMVDPIDEWLISSLTEFDGKPIVSITKGDLDLGELNQEELKEVKKADEELKSVKEFFRKTLQENVKEVRASTRLIDSPSCLVADKGEMSANMERILRMANQGDVRSKKILEINPEHPVIKHVQSILEKDPKSIEGEDWAYLLYDQALLAEGAKVTDPKKFNERLNKVLVQSLKS